jgi:hypothetical protein
MIRILISQKKTKKKQPLIKSTITSHLLGAAPLPPKKIKIE